MFQSSWSAPSNIALIKYWGKKGKQLPLNPSVSLTLSKSMTITSIKIAAKKNELGTRDFLFESMKIENRTFFLKLENFLADLEKSEMLWLKDYDLTLDTRNTFPHSTGIASSASSFASVALALSELELQIQSKSETSHYTLNDLSERASFIARLGSGSACRSVVPIAAIWGATNTNENAKYSKDEMACALATDDLIASAQEWSDAILIISKIEKTISSTHGHYLMQEHDLLATRIKIANKHFEDLMTAWKNKDWPQWCQIIEKEALWLHAMMMTSQSPYLLMEGNTVNCIQKFIEWRDQHKITACFTLDAGPNVHILYHASCRLKVLQWIKSDEIQSLCQAGWIDDFVGMGPRKIK